MSAGTITARARSAARPPGLAELVWRAFGVACAHALIRARSQRRISALALVMFLAVAGLIGKLVAVQLYQVEEFAELAARQAQRELPLPAQRGAITDRSGEPLAMSLAAATVYGNPAVLADDGVEPVRVALELAPVLGMDLREVTRLLSGDASFVYLGRQLPRAVGEQVEALDLPGIGVLSEPRRVYPGGSTAGQVVGFAGIDNQGLAGIELAYDTQLAGVPGTLRLEQAPGGVEITAAPREVEPPVPGLDLVLTIDRALQHETERILAEAVETYGAIGGSAVVLDARTGELLALASVPTVDPEQYAAADDYARRNRAVTDVFEPGSVNKVVTVAAALEEGVVGVDEGFNVPWQIAVGPELFHDSDYHPDGWWSTGEIIARSSNVGTIMMAQRLGSEGLHAYVEAFGIGRPTTLWFPGESHGLLAPPEDWTVSSLPTIAIGQGVSATLVQVAQVFAVIAAGGEWVAPSLVRGTMAADGTFTPTAAPERRRVISQEVADAVAGMLVDVVEAEHGTGSLAAVPGYTVGGKTGTAQKPLEGERGYAEDAFIASFAGFAPVDDPALVVAVMLDEPTPHYGGLTAAPTFSRIMEQALVSLRVPADVAGLPAPAPAPAVLAAGPAVGSGG